MRKAVALFIAAGTLIAARVGAQSCYTRTTVGSSAAINRVVAVEDVTTPPNVPANMDVLGETPTTKYYRVSTFAGPDSVTIATALVSGSISDNDKAPLGLTFINGGATDIKIRQVTVSSDRTGGKLPLFRTSPHPTNIDPLVGSWAISTDQYDAIWTAPAGGYTVSAKTAQAFLANIFVSNVRQAITDDVVGGTIVACASVCNGTDDLPTYPANGYATDLFVPSQSEKVATAMVAFVDGGVFPHTTTAATYGPPSNLVGGQPGTLTMRVKEWSGNEAIRAGLQMTVTLPPLWTNVSVTSAAAPWDITTTTVTAVSGNPTVGWMVTIATNADIQKGKETGDVVITATPPVVYTKSTFQSKISLNGHDSSNVPTGGHLIRSVCDGGGTILPVSGGGSAPAINVEFLSPRLNAGVSNAPVEQVDFRTDVKMMNVASALSVTAEVYQYSGPLAGTWQPIATTAPLNGTSATVTQSYSGTSLYDVLDDNMRMRIRLSSSAGGPQTLAIDYLNWTAQTYWVVDNTPGTGSDNWPTGTRFPGSSQSPFATVTKAASVVTGAERVRVMVGSSQSGTAYSGNVSLSGAAVAGTTDCPTWIEGVSSGSQLPRVRGSDPSADWGFDVAANYVKISGFRTENMLAGFLAENPSTNIVFDGNSMQVPTYGFGIVLNNYQTTPTTPSTGLQATSNTIDGTGYQPFMGIYDAGSQGAIIDSNKIVAFPNFGMYLDGASSPAIQRNIVTGGYFGIYLARTSGANLYNNSIDMNSYRGIHCESSTGIVSRNNIISRNLIGFSTDTANSVNSDYDDLWSNSNSYSGLSAGAHSMSVDPVFIQTSTSSASDYYQLNTGSQCIDKGTNVGLTFLGLNPDLGAVESQ